MPVPAPVPRVPVPVPVPVPPVPVRREGDTGTDWSLGSPSPRRVSGRRQRRGAQYRRTACNLFHVATFLCLEEPCHSACAPHALRAAAPPQQSRRHHAFKFDSVWYGPDHHRGHRRRITSMEPFSPGGVNSHGRVWRATPNRLGAEVSCACEHAHLSHERAQNSPNIAMAVAMESRAPTEMISAAACSWRRPRLSAAG